MERKKMGAAAIIRNEQGRVLLVKHTYGKLNWDLPGGAAELNESVEGTAIRETREETGLEVVADHMVPRIYYDPLSDFHHFVFVCRPVKEPLPPGTDSPEISEWGYFMIDQLPRPISDFTVQRIQDALSPEIQPAVVEVGPRVWLDTCSR